MLAPKVDSFKEQKASGLLPALLVEEEVLGITVKSFSGKP